MLVLSDQQVRRLAEPAEVIEALRAAFTRDFSQTLRMPVRSSVEIAGGVLLLMPAYDSEIGLAGVKTVTVTKARGVDANYELLDAITGEPLARMQANWLTDLRTAATSALATDLLSRRDARVLGVFGSGRQAEAHLAILPLVRRFERFLVCGSGRRDLAAFRDRMQREHGITIEPVDAKTCASEADVICTCTTSPTPVFDGRWLRPGTHLNMVGAFQPHTRECDDETARLARIVVDTYDGAMAEAGDILIPLHEGVITREQIIGDLHEIASGRRQGRTSAQEITLFKSVGCALEDLVTAALLFERANGGYSIKHSKPAGRRHEDL
jgi:ornithine cyclodeaminase/alanine dehydrogenase-like protein (mu-crystallin family)